MKWQIALVLILLLASLCEAGKKDRNRRNKGEKKKATKKKTSRRQNNDKKGGKNNDMEKKMAQLAKQLLMQQFYVEEQARSSGNSGLKIMRMRNEGTRPYHGTSHADDFTMGAIHDHADFVNTCGMGEVVAVLNGVEFKTRHNDYLLVRKSTTSSEYGATEEIPYPPVPPSVTTCGTLHHAIDELREYFQAWGNQDDSVKDYKPYFKANLCYMEGAWTLADPESIQEPFFSERHWLEADSWTDLFQKTRYSSYSGTKENLENYAFMPTTLWEVKDDGEYIFGQWNYRIYCHPLKDDLPLNRLRAIDDLKIRMSTQKTYDEYVMSRNARFQINPVDSDSWYDGPTKHGLLDEMMVQIPGMDNEGTVHHDRALGNTIKEFNTQPGDNTELNTSFYHRWFQNEDNGAMGVKVRHRGLNDENLWAAMNDQDNILPIKVEKCYTSYDQTRECESWEQKWSYAIPMEIIYTTPLNSWNPHNIEFKGFDKEPLGQTVFAGPGGYKRDGSPDVDKAFNGTNSGKYYRTPYEFFEGNEIDVDPADTPKNFVHVLDKDGNMHQVRGSGIRTFMPDIATVGRLRQRYPVAPLYGDGNPIAKELEALKDIVLHPDKYGFMITNDQSPGGPQTIFLTLEAGAAGHTHDVVMTASKLADLATYGHVDVMSEPANNHQHLLTIERRDNDPDKFTWDLCNGETECRDGHSHDLIKV